MLIEIFIWMINCLFCYLCESVHQCIILNIMNYHLYDLDQCINLNIMNYHLYDLDFTNTIYFLLDQLISSPPVVNSASRLCDT